MTRTGQLLGFRRGLERIVRGTGCPIIPTALEGVWAGPFSFPRCRSALRLPKPRSQPVTVAFGPPLPETADAAEVRQAVEQLLAEIWIRNARGADWLPYRFVATARRHPFRIAMVDEKTGPIRFGRALIGAVWIARRFRPHWTEEDRVGILLPPCVPAALVNWAVLLAGKVPVHFNYTLDPTSLSRCVQLAGVKFVISAQRFLEKVRVELPVPVLDLETVLKTAPKEEKLRATFAAWLLPRPLLAHWLGNRSNSGATPKPADRPATLIFSSGSTGEPKGVILTHANVLTNVEQIARIFDFTPHDRILGVLPFFHSFGFTVGLILPGILGTGVVFHPSPLDTAALGPLLHRERVTILITTPTFLQLYLRTFVTDAWKSVRLIITGAEKLPMRLAEACEQRTGIRPLEGYGCTECGPVVSVNIPDFETSGLQQQGHKPGSVGRPIPGVAVRVVDPLDGKPLPLGATGVLCVRGPNIMQGYWQRPDLTAAAIRDGWYITGDMARVDADGFIYITDRLARFSKIGGEMVPHVKVEEALHQLAGVTERSFVVTAVPDDTRGERLIILHLLDEDRLQQCLSQLRTTSLLPNLWKPKPESFYRVDAFPVLASGKLDLSAVRKMAEQKARPSESHRH